MTNIFGTKVNGSQLQAVFFKWIDSYPKLQWMSRYFDVKYNEENIYPRFSIKYKEGNFKWNSSWVRFVNKMMVVGFIDNFKVNFRSTRLISFALTI